MIRLGLIGVGAWGKRYVDTIARRSDCRLVAVARATARAADAAQGVPVCTHWRDLVRLGEQGELDGVIVATTPEHQAEVVAEGIARGLPVLAEKPLGMGRAVSTDLLSAWERSAHRPPVLVNFVHLWAPAYLALVDHVQGQGGATAIRRVASAGASSGPFRGWSSLYDYGPHDCAMLVRLLGEGAPVRILAARRLETVLGPQAELFDFELRSEDIPVTITLGNGSPEKSRRFAVELRNGQTLIYDDVRPHPHKLTLDGEPVPIAATMPLDVVVGDYVARIGHWRAGSPAPRDGRGGLVFCGAVADLLDALAAAIS